jgi:serine/threonine protein kinase
LGKGTDSEFSESKIQPRGIYSELTQSARAENVKVIFEGAEEVMRTINAGGSLAHLLGFPDMKKCSLMGSEIQIAKFLGKGVQGKAYLIKFPHLNVGNRLYVIKRLPVVFKKIDGPKSEWSQYILEHKFDTKMASIQSREDMVDFDNAKDNEVVTLSLPAGLCKLSEDKQFVAIPSSTNRLITVPKGSYICEDNSISEFVLGVYAGMIFQKGKSINFFNVYSTFICPNDERANTFEQYVFMDKIDSDVKREFESVKDNKFNICARLNEKILFKHYNFDGKPCPFEDIVTGVYIQVLFAIAAYQQLYGISHNDLKPDNIFVEYVTENTIFGGVHLWKAKWYSYVFNKKTIYFPAIPLIVKIGDYGLAIKYSEPIVGDATVFYNGYDQNDGDGPWIPNYLVPSYDSLFFSYTFAALIDAHFHASTLPQLIAGSFYYMIPELDKNNPNTGMQLINLGYINPNNGRPILKNIRKVKSAAEILRNVVMPYVQHKEFNPKNGDVVCQLGKI